MHNLKFIAISLTIVFAGIFAFGQSTYALEIKAMRFGNHDQAVRLVLELDDEADFRASVQGQPPRLLLDMPMISRQPVINRNALPELIKDIRLAPLENAYSRLTFLLNHTAVIRSAFLMPATGKMPTRLVVDLTSVTSDVFTKHVDRPYGTLSIRAGNDQLPFAGSGGIKLGPISKPSAPQVPDAAKPENPEKLPIIMIDAGHGGIDPGASGSGVREKDVTLAVAQAARTALEASGRYRVKLTRARDAFIPLQERVRIARREDADLFISIHADSLAGKEGSSAHGASVYTISDQASDEQTAQLADRENQADLLAGIVLPVEDKEVANILVDLATRETTAQSKRFAGTLIQALSKNSIPLVPSPHRHAGFVVLKAPDVPSVLIELGFLSNPEEARKLASERYRQGLGKAIADGIETWLKARKP